MSPNVNDEVVKEAKETVEDQEQISMPIFGNILKRYPDLGIWIQAFVMTFIAEWGDRTQISTIALSSSNPAIAVTIGAILGHGICTVIAVVGGSLVAGRISERIITGIGGFLFLVFGVVTYLEGV